MHKLSNPATEMVWSQYLETDHLDLQLVKKEVATSWRRCRALGIDPLNQERADAGQLELRERLQLRKHLVKVAHPFMADLYSFVQGSGFQVILADEEGYLLEVIGDPGILAQTRQVQLSPGGNWNEEIKGTNAIGTAIVEKRPVQIHAWEHWCQPHHFLTCSAAPIFDPEGCLIGVLDITGDFRHANAHTLGMVVAAVNAIENQLRLQKTTAKLYLAYRYSSTLLESMSEGLVSIDTGGIITELNTTGGRILGIHPNSAKGRHINDVLRTPAPMLQLLTHGNEYRDREISLAKLGKTIYSSASLLHDDGGRVIGAVAVLREGRPAIQGKPLLPRYSFADLIGASPAILEARQWAERAAAMPSTVLLTGESGTGKELFAQAIHSASPRCRGPFVALNCAALPESLIESELFGYEEGAFTGTKKGGQAGKFEQAHGGTILLDEIGDMPLGVQAKLLRVIQEKKIARLGAAREMPVDLRIIAATHKDLAAEVRAGRFREDLYYRLNVVAIRIPALRERKDDLPLLVCKLLERIAVKLSRELQAGEDFLDGLAAHHWPGNVRELENVLERAALRAGAGNVLTSAHLLLDSPVVDTEPTPPTQPTAGEPIRSLKEVEKEAIARALAKHGGNISQAATDLAIGRNTLYRKIKEYGLSV
ncbi:MAG: sigma-54-dependent Fis family transcriptional regulator [Desulfuromonadales bacterium]|nr:sigma-54-dependent Fis family transcriptional regulator [Desulfuromonadales bacterium]